MSMNVTLVGNLTRDPELRFTPGGDAVASFTVAVNERVKQGNEWVDGEASFYDVKAWRHLGEAAAENLSKGTRVIVIGKQKIEKYQTKDGDQRQKVVVTADEIGPSIRFKTAAPVQQPSQQFEEAPF